VRDPFRPVVGQAVRDDQDAGVRLADLEEGDGKPDEVVPVPGQQGPPLGRVHFVHSMEAGEP
jgi:hypothetical protein